jgi:hypothetical protein
LAALYFLQVILGGFDDYFVSKTARDGAKFVFGSITIIGRTKDKLKFKWSEALLGTMERNEPCRNCAYAIFRSEPVTPPRELPALPIGGVECVGAEGSGWKFVKRLTARELRGKQHEFESHVKVRYSISTTIISW